VNIELLPSAWTYYIVVLLTWLCSPNEMVLLCVKAKLFREFWGDVSEMRRFQDSSICEAVVWKGKTLADRRTITAQIVKHVLDR
jgi:hypothetical protein